MAPLAVRDGVFERQLDLTRSLRRRLYGLLPLRRARSVFEPGCGTGRVLGEVARITRASLAGVDIDAEALASASSRVPEARLDLGDVERLRPPRADIVLVSHLLGEVCDPGGLVERITRAMPSGGCLAILGEYDWNRAAEMPQDAGLLKTLMDAMRSDGRGFPSGGEIASMLGRSGMAVVESGWTGAPPTPPDMEFFLYQTAPLIGRDTAETLLERCSATRFSLPVFYALARKV